MNRKLTLKEIKRLNSKRTQGKWLTDLTDIVSVAMGKRVEIIAENIITDIDIDFITASPLLAEQYIRLADSIKFLANTSDYCGDYLKDLMKEFKIE